jgi:sugar ABC transporter, permease protein
MSERIGRAALPARRRPRAGKLLRTYGTGTLFFLPFFLFFIVFVIVPVVMAIILSATDYNLLQAPNFIGLDNYKTLFLDDDVFLIALKNTLTFAFIAGPLAFILSFLLAWAINQMRCRNLFALAFYVPSILNAIAIGVVWSYIFSPDRFGLINNFLFNLGVINEPILWNMSEKTILPIIIVIHVWMNMGTNFLVMLAGLQNTSAEVHEAGLIDGVRNRVQELVYLTIPQLKPQMLFSAITVVTNSFAVFEISVSFAGMPSPNYAGHTIVTHLYDYAFIRFEMGYASAVACILFFLTFVIGRILNHLLTSND